MSYIGNNEIGKMWLGNIEIDEAYLGSTLVYERVPDPSEYVQSGLVMHLDGIDKGQTSGRWESLVGSTYYTLTSASTSETKSVLMNGEGCITATNGTNTSSAGTIEVCAHYFTSGSGIIIHGAATNRLCFTVASNGYSFFNSGASNTWGVTKVPLFTCSMNGSRCMINGITGGTLITNTWGNVSDTIGGRGSGTNRYYANVRIYSIRKYNRVLTEQEMLHNQRIDNKRFGLGLTI